MSSAKTRNGWMVAMVGSLALAACSPEPDPASTNPTPTKPTNPSGEEELPPPFEAATPPVYVAKVKNLLLGQPPSEAEVATVSADPAALPPLIDQWMTTPEFQGRMIEFFRNAFQQNQVLTDNLVDMLPVGLGNNATFRSLMLRNIQDSFARTAWGIVAEGRPFNETVTTRRLMMTPPLAMIYSYMDAVHVNDKLGQTNRILTAKPAFSYKVRLGGEAIPIEESLDPAHANYMTFQTTAVPPVTALADCQVNPRVYNRTTTSLYNLLFGSLDAHATCTQTFTSTPYFTEADFDAWRWVNIRAPQAGEAVTTFYDLKALRGQDEMVLKVPRVGFFSTPAFHANWQTNSSNQARVTMNQVLIVALGKSFDGTNNTTLIKEPALDAEHASNPDCYACHKTLDPMRQAFRQAVTLAYHEQTDAAQAGLKGVFAFGGVTKDIADLDDLAQTMASHPRFALAWTAKLCNWANSAPCLESDPEIVRIAEVFQRSSFNWKTLVREMMSSPLVTAAADTKTFQELGVALSISRRDQLCGALGARLGLPDPCGQYALRRSTMQTAALGFSALVPADGYSRGAENSTLANDPNLFFRAASENLCVTFASAVVDPVAPAINRFPSTKPDESMDDMVRSIMALTPQDRRTKTARQILGQHFSEARASGSTAVDALRSTFVLACLSPTSVAVGL